MTTAIRPTRSPPALRLAASFLRAGFVQPVRIVFETSVYLVALCRLLYQSFVSMLWEGRKGSRLARQTTLQQIFLTAVQSLPLTVFVAVAVGALLMHQASKTLHDYGFTDYAEWLTVLILFREITPMTVALLVISRSANMIVVEIGSMRVNGEIRALEVLGINLDRFIILPRITAMVTSVVLLTICFCGAALWGGFWLAKGAGLLESDYLLSSLIESFTPEILRNILLRAFSFGVIIAAVASLHGLWVAVSPTEVPQQASRSVVRSLTLCFVLNFVFSVYL